MVEIFKKFCEEHSEKYYVYEKYSGRFMFGRTCPAIVVKNGYSYMVMMMELTMFMNDYVDEIDLDTFENIAVDELGLDTIVYFPAYKE